MQPPQNHRHPSPLNTRQLQFRIRLLIWIFITGLVLSGATAIPLETELSILCHWVTGESSLALWLAKIRDALIDSNQRYPFLAYGYDWLAFGHFAIAIAFIGPLRDPVRNIWVIEFAMIACALIIPYAFIFGALRGIPVYWRLIDCSFGVFGIIPLFYCRNYIIRLAEYSSSSTTQAAPESSIT